MRPTVDKSNLVSVFHQQVSRYPDRIAVSAHDGTLTYHQLDEKSSEVGKRLMKAGVNPGAVVALLTARTTTLAVGILGILKAGGAYLPLDCTHPGERTAELVRLADCSVVVTNANLLSDSTARADTSALRAVLADEPDTGTNSPTRRNAVPNTPTQRNAASLAYILPTSGSTGTPKGAQVEDRNVVALVDALRTTVLGPLDGPLRISLVSPHVFDASVQQIFSALLLGHTLVIVPEHMRADGGELRRFWVDEQIDVSDGTPAHLRIVAHARSAPRVRLRCLLVGGDVLSTEVLRRFLDECENNIRIVNVYGVAECCVDSLAEVVDPVESHDSVPIGTALPGTIVKLMDEQGHPVPDGKVGEIHLGGLGIGRGYIGRPDLTAERFYTDPEQPDQRRYRTGDMARRLPDGRLVFMGRVDRQFKLRGNRIEPGEIESALRRYGGKAMSDAHACQVCLLTSAHPNVSVIDGLCSVCQRFKTYSDKVMSYFGDTAALLSIIQQHSTRERSGYDVMLLFSGGKDSTYALYRLLDLDLRVLAFTFDNGYISSTAFENIRRITRHANVDLEIGSVPVMDAVFTESLRNDSTVCSGCFRGLTSMSTRQATERGIGVVMTGLSRGQIFDTKLRRLVESGITEPEEIDRRLMVHRKVYHARQDRTAELLALPLADEQLDEILFLDYFRYDDVTASQVRKFR
jgi:amino acid adenylation domain-containing protein